VELLRDEQIAEVDGAELTETDQAADRLPVFIASPRCRTLGRAPAGRMAGSGERGRKHAAPGTHDLPLEAGNLQLVARLHHGVPGSGEQRLVLGTEGQRRRVALDARSVVDEVADGNTRGELGRPAVVVSVEVCDEQVVDRLH